MCKVSIKTLNCQQHVFGQRLRRRDIIQLGRVRAVRFQYALPLNKDKDVHLIDIEPQTTAGIMTSKSSTCTTGTCICNVSVSTADAWQTWVVQFEFHGLRVHTPPRHCV